MHHFNGNIGGILVLALIVWALLSSGKSSQS
jgi:hypothetical protein